MKISASVDGRDIEIEVDRRDGSYIVRIDGKQLQVDAMKLEDDFYSILVAGRSYEVSVEAVGDGYQVRHGAAQQTVLLTDPSRRARAGQAGDSGPERIATMMPGKVVRILVEEGDVVEAGQGILVVEAMKMENEIAASRAGRVSALRVEVGQAVEGGAELAVITPEI